MAEQLGEAVLVLRTDDRAYDRGVSQAKAKGQDLGRTLDATKGSAIALAGGLDQAGTSAGRYASTGTQVVAVSGAQRAGLQQLTQNLSDVTTMYSLGARGSQIFGSQIGQLVQSIQLLSGGTSKFALFMSSPWGIAITSATMVLGPLAAMLLESRDAASDSGKAQETLADRLDQTKHSYAEVTKAIAEYNKQEKQATITSLENAEAVAKTTANLINQAIATREALKARLTDVQAANRERASAPGVRGEIASVPGAGLGEQMAIQGRIDAQDAEIKRLKGLQAGANVNVATERARIQSDPVAAVEERFDRLRDAARASITDVDKLTARLADLNKQEDAAVKNARDDRSGKTERDAAAADRRAQREADKEARQQESYNRDLAAMGKELVDLRRQMAGTLAERYKVEQEQLEISIAEQRRRIVDNRDYSAAEKAKLLAQLEIKASLERELLERRNREEIARQDLEIAQALRANEQDLLTRQLRLAETREERRTIELRILDLTYQQERAQLEAVIASRDSTEAQKKIAEARLAQLGQMRSGDERAIEREYASPGQRYLREVNGLGSSINDQMESVAVDGLRTLEDRLTSVIMQTKSLGAAFKDVATQIIADLVRISIQRAVIGPLSSLIFGGSTGGMMSGDAFLSSSLGGGGDGGFFSSLGSFFGGHADGGLIPTGGWGIVGERGPEPVRATSAGIQVAPNSSLGGGRPGSVHVTVSGARGNSEIEAMVRAGVRQGIAAYDSGVGDRVKDNLARRG